MRTQRVYGSQAPKHTLTAETSATRTHVIRHYSVGRTVGICTQYKSERGQVDYQAIVPQSGHYSIMSIVQQLTVFARDNPLLLLAALPIMLVAAKVVNYLTDPSGLRSYPGPFLAKFTDAWIFWKVSHNRWSSSIEDVHKKYGNIPLMQSYKMANGVSQVPLSASLRITFPSPTLRHSPPSMATPLASRNRTGTIFSRISRLRTYSTPALALNMRGNGAWKHTCSLPRASARLNPSLTRMSLNFCVNGTTSLLRLRRHKKAGPTEDSLVLPIGACKTGAFGPIA